MISIKSWKNRVKFFIPGVLFLAALVIPSSHGQQVDYSSESLFMAIFANGDALVEYDVSIEDPLDEEVRIPLFGEIHINDLIVVDFEDQLIEYEIGSTPNEIVLNTPGVSNVRISYTTPDLVNRVRGIWTFSVNATTEFIVRLPPDSVLIDTEPIPAINFVNDQPLLTFDQPGDIRVEYAIGVLGTETQANIAIQLANAAIRETIRNNPGIVLTDAEQLLQRATDARDDRRFGDAEDLAGQANDAAVTAAFNYKPAQAEIDNAEIQVEQAENEGRAVSVARQLLEQANSEFASGNYVASREIVKQVAGAIGERQPAPVVPIAAIIAVVLAIAGGLGALVFFKIRKPAERPIKKESQKPPTNNRPSTLLRPSEVKNKPVEPAEPEPIESNMPIEQGIIPESQVDKSVLGKIVDKVLEERPHLRPEDQQVLKFLAEKEGAAFESEIRTKFQLPKTTIWRLVKRLEREELVEIRKAGGQNLIKLRFEDQQL